MLTWKHGLTVSRHWQEDMHRYKLVTVEQYNSGFKTRCSNKWLSPWATELVVPAADGCSLAEPMSTKQWLHSADRRRFFPMLSRHQHESRRYVPTQLPLNLTRQHDHDATDSCQWHHQLSEIWRIHHSTVVMNCCKGDRPSQWETPIFGPL